MTTTGINPNVYHRESNGGSNGLGPRLSESGNGSPLPPQAKSHAYHLVAEALWLAGSPFCRAHLLSSYLNKLPLGHSQAQLFLFGLTAFFEKGLPTPEPPASNAQSMAADGRARVCSQSDELELHALLDDLHRVRPVLNLQTYCLFLTQQLCFRALSPEYSCSARPLGFKNYFRKLMRADDPLPS